MPKSKKQAIQEDPNLFWMIRRKSDGKYASGNTRPYWHEHGKVWNKHARLVTHLKLVKNNLEWYAKRGRPMADPYLGCEIVQFRRSEEAKADCETYGE
jgi:hypothetical protein